MRNFTGLILILGTEPIWMKPVTQNSILKVLFIQITQGKMRGDCKSAQEYEILRV